MNPTSSTKQRLGDNESPTSLAGTLRSGTATTATGSRVSHEMLRAEAMRALSSGLDGIGSERTEISTQSAATRLSTRLSSGQGDDEHLEDPVHVEDPGELDDPCAACATINLPFRNVTATTTMPCGQPPAEAIAGLPSQRLEPPKRYKQVRLIGQGAYGSAWLCLDTLADNRPVVVKSMSVPSMTPKAWELTQNEIKCLADANHPNIIRFYDAQMENHTQHIAMEYADAGDLGQIIAHRAAKRMPLSEREALFLFVQLSMALQHVHSKAILHRDVKSANVLMMTNGLVKLGDFGFSRQYNNDAVKGTSDGGGSSSDGNTTTSCSAQTFCGTPYYLAPELWTNSKYGKKADVWSLGIILYELLTFRRPFAGSNVQALATSIVSGIYEPLSSAECSPSVQQLVALLLDVDPNRRPSMLSLFNHPVVRDHLVLLRTAIDNNARICDTVKRQWHGAAVDVLNQSAALPVGGAGAEVPIPSHSGFVRRYVAGGPTPSWTLHQLSLEGGGCTLVLASAPPPEASARSAPPQPASSSRKEIPAAQLRAVMAVPQEASFGVPGVFAVTTKDGRCTWFQAQTEHEREKWIRLLRLAIVHALG